MGSVGSVAKRVESEEEDAHVENDPWEDMFTNPSQVLAVLPSLLHVTVAHQIQRQREQ
jgi:hypothetical protein